MWLISILDTDVDLLHLDQTNRPMSILYTMLVKSVASPLPFWSEKYKHVVQYSLDVPSGTVLCFCLLFLSNLCSLSLIILNLRLLTWNVQILLRQGPDNWCHSGLPYLEISPLLPRLVMVDFYLFPPCEEERFKKVLMINWFNEATWKIAIYPIKVITIYLFKCNILGTNA